MEGIIYLTDRFEYTLLREGKVHIFGLSWRDEQIVAQFLTGIRAEYAKLGSDYFIRVKHLKQLIDYIDPAEQEWDAPDPTDLYNPEC